MAWAQVTGQTEPPGAAAAEPASQRVASAREKITLWEPLVSNKFATYEKVALIANVFVALAGLAYAPDARQAGAEVRRRAHRGCRKLRWPCGKGPMPTCSVSFASSAC